MSEFKQNQPCQFCRKVTEIALTDTEDSTVYAYCETCGATSPSVDVGDYMEWSEHYDLHPQRQEIIDDTWNTRKPEPGQPAVVQDNKIIGWIGEDPSGHGGGFTQERLKAHSWGMKGFRVTPVCKYKPTAVQSEPVAQGICETTQTERFTYSGCECGTYKGNLGPCKTWHSGGDPVRCVYCDHDVACHIALYTHSTLTVHSSESQDAANWRKLMKLVDDSEERKTAKVSFYRRSGVAIHVTGIVPEQKNYCVMEYRVTGIHINTLSYPTFEECMNCIPG